MLRWATSKTWTPLQIEKPRWLFAFFAGVYRIFESLSAAGEQAESAIRGFGMIFRDFEEELGNEGFS